MPTYVYKIEAVDERPYGDNLQVALWSDGIVVERKVVPIPAGTVRATALTMLESAMAPLVDNWSRTHYIVEGDEINAA